MTQLSVETGFKRKIRRNDGRWEFEELEQQGRLDPHWIPYANHDQSMLESVRIDAISGYV